MAGLQPVCQCRAPADPQEGPAEGGGTWHAGRQAAADVGSPVPVRGRHMTSRQDVSAASAAG